MQADKSTDTAGISVFLAFVNTYCNHVVEEKMFMCIHLPSHKTGEYIFNLTDLYMAEKGLSWKQCVDISTDGEINGWENVWFYCTC
jgi:hypothetical protein